MKVIIAGSRALNKYDMVEYAVKRSQWNMTEVVCGMAQGVDLLGKRYGELHDIPVAEFPADWNQFGKSAGFRRNKQMGYYADALIAIWDGESRGTKHMIELINCLDKPSYVFVWKGN